MIRIEIEIEEIAPGKIDILGRSYHSAWTEPTANEKDAAGRIGEEIQLATRRASDTIGHVEAVFGADVDQAKREGRI